MFQNYRILNILKLDWQIPWNTLILCSGWVLFFLNEMDAAICAPILYDTNTYFIRCEWGPNANPHWHRLMFSEKLDIFSLGTQTYRAVMAAAGEAQQVAQPKFGIFLNLALKLAIFGTRLHPI